MNHRNGALCIILVVSLSMTLASVSCVRVRAQQPNLVGLVVDLGNGTVATRCVEFNQPEISGYDVLRQSGLPIVADEVAGTGVIICDIGGVSGCSVSNCFCRCQGMDCTYWAYYNLEGVSWRYSSLGASAHTVQHGDVEGWAWGKGSIGGGGAQPPVIPFEQICSTHHGPVTAEPPASPTDAPTLTTNPTTRVSRTPSPSPSPVSTVMSSSTASANTQSTSTPSPTVEPTKSSSPPPTDEAAPSPPPTTVPLTSPSPSEPGSASSSVTRTNIAQVQPTDTPVQVADVESLEDEPLTKEEVAPPTADDSPSPLQPIGYVASILMIGGLVGWLIYVLRFRGQRA